MRATKTMAAHAEMKADPADDRIVEGYASVFGNVDSHGDVVEAGAFAETIKSDFAAPGEGRANRVKVLYQHDASRVIGRPLALSEDTKGLHFKARISDTSDGRDVLALIKDGALDEMSFGFDVQGWEERKSGEGPTHLALTKLKLWEISPVTWGANALTTVEAKALSRICDGLDAAGLESVTRYAAELKARRSGPRDGALIDAMARFRAGLGG